MASGYLIEKHLGTMEHTGAMPTLLTFVFQGVYEGLYVLDVLDVLGLTREIVSELW